MSEARASAVPGTLPDPAPVLIAGPVTWDRFVDRTEAGGAVSYAARVAAALGIRAHILTNSGHDMPVEALQGHDVHLGTGAATLVFVHQFSDRMRSMRLVAAPGRRLSLVDIPGTWPPPRTLILAPLLPDDLDVHSLRDASNAEEIALLAQGLQRQIEADGRVANLDAPSEALLDAVDDRVTVFLSHDETAAWPGGAIDDVARRCRRLVVTRGRDGASIYAAHSITHVPARPAMRVDPTGAGDVFAAAFILAVRAGEQVAARIAAAYAAANIERHGPAPLPSWTAIKRLLASEARGADGSVKGTR
jgi:1D-myo-inositol 3-kinase